MIYEINDYITNKNEMIIKNQLKENFNEYKQKQIDKISENIVDDLINMKKEINMNLNKCIVTNNKQMTDDIDLKIENNNKKIKKKHD